MSAYQVDTECLGRVLKAISKAGAYGPRYKQIQKLKDQYNKNAGKVFDQLLDLNRFSLAERYPDDSHELHHDVDRNKAVWYSRQLGHADVQLYKSLGCFLYQACEGDANKKKDVFAHDLASKQPGYEDAKMGLIMNKNWNAFKKMMVVELLLVKQQDVNKLTTIEKNYQFVYDITELEKSQAYLQTC